jgi:hypothetical protein
MLLDPCGSSIPQTSTRVETPALRVRTRPPTMSTRCYGIDGSPYASFDRYIPCNATAAATGGHTSCCAPGDNCLTNGLCQGPSDEKRKANLFWRNGCTDPTWNDAACPKHCEGLGMSCDRRPGNRSHRSLQDEGLLTPHARQARHTRHLLLPSIELVVLSYRRL